MDLKQQFKQDVKKYGYVFLGMSLDNIANGLIALSAFSDPENAFACYEPLQKAKKYFDIFVFYLPFEEAKNAASSGEVQCLNINPGINAKQFFCLNPKDEDFIGLLKNWFERVENGQKGDK